MASQQGIACRYGELWSWKGKCRWVLSMLPFFLAHLRRFVRPSSLLWQWAEGKADRLMDLWALCMRNAEEGPAATRLR